MKLIPDTIDFQAYARGGDTSAKVRPASSFREALHREFVPRISGARASEMFSTKLAGKLEFRPGEVTAWAGYNGHRKSMFTSQLMLDLCVQREPVLGMSLEMVPARTLRRMTQQAAGMAVPASSFIDHFSHWTDGRLWIFDHMGRFAPDQAIAVCNYFAQELGGRHVFIDSMMMVCRSEESLDEQKQFVTDAVQLAQETGLHVHIVAHMKKPPAGDESKPPTKYDIRGSAAISDQCANVVTIWANMKRKKALEAMISKPDVLEEPDAIVSVEKQRNGAFEGQLKQWFDPSSFRFMNDRYEPVEAYELRDAPAEQWERRA